MMASAIIGGNNFRQLVLTSVAVPLQTASATGSRALSDLQLSTMWSAAIAAS